MSNLIWIKSPYCGSNACVEVARGTKVHVRDGKDRDGPVLTFGRAAWTAFVKDVATMGD